MVDHDQAGGGSAQCVFAYLDTNAVNDFFGPRPPVDQAMRGQLLGAVQEGRLVVPFSGAVAQEIAAVSVNDRVKAAQIARFYFKVASLDHAVGNTAHALRAAVTPHLKGVRLSPYETLSAAQIRNIKRRLLNKAPSDLDEFVAEGRRNAQDYVVETQAFRDAARTLIASTAQENGMQPPKPISVREATARWWPELAPGWARGVVERDVLKGQALSADLVDGLLQIPGVRGRVGVAVALAATQAINGRNPTAQDYGDHQHVSLAVCSGLPLVTHDQRLRNLVEAIPDSPLEVISAAQLLDRAK